MQQMWIYVLLDKTNKIENGMIFKHINTNIRLNHIQNVVMSPVNFFIFVNIRISFLVKNVYVQ